MFSRRIRRASRFFTVFTLGVSLAGLTIASQSSAWSTPDPTRAIVFEGKSGAGDGVEFAAFNDIMAVDEVGNVYAIVVTGGELQIGPGPQSQTVGNLADYSFVITKSDTNGDLVWHVLWQGTTLQPAALTFAGSSLFVAAQVEGTVDVDPTSGTDLYSPVSGATDLVVLEFTSSGTYVGRVAISTIASKSVSPRFLSTTSDGNVLVGGSYTGDTTFPGHGTETASAPEGFLAKINRNTGNADWVITASNGSTSAQIEGVVEQSDGTLFIKGSSAASPVTLIGSDASPESLTFSGSNGSFVAQFSPSGAIATASAASSGIYTWIGLGDDSVLAHYQNGDLVRFTNPATSTVVGSLAVQSQMATRTADGKVRLVGSFNGPVDFDVTSGVNTITPSATEGFVLTLSPSFTTDSLQRFTGPTNPYVQSALAMPDGGYMVVGYSTAGTMNLSNVSSTGTFTSSSGMSHFMFLVRYDAAGTTGTTTTTTTTTTTIAPVSAPATTSYVTGNKKVTVKWSAVAGASSYVVSTSAGTTKCTATTTSCVVSGLKNGKLYTYYVRALNSAGQQSADARSVRVIPGYKLRTTTYKVKKKPLLTSILTTASKGAKRWSVTSGSCRISGSRLVMPTKAGSCRLRLSVAQKGSYPAMSTTVKVTVTR